MTQTEKIYKVLSANRRKRVSILSLYKASGSLCISTKCSELRKKGLEIENKLQRQKNGIVYSWYRLNRGVLK